MFSNRLLNQYSAEMNVDMNINFLHIRTQVGSTKNSEQNTNELKFKLTTKIHILCVLFLLNYECFTLYEF